jgi:hypothetical protein
MLNKNLIKARLFSAAVHDVTENPSILSTPGGRSDFQNMIGIEVLSGIKNRHGATKFPHLRAEVKNVISEAKAENWATTGRYMGALPGAVMNLQESQTDAAKEASTPGTWDVINSLASTVGTIGTEIWKAKETAELEKDKLEAIAAQTAALQNAAAQQQQAAQFQAAAMHSGRSSGLGGAIVPIAIAGVVGIGALIYFKSR